MLMPLFSLLQLLHKKTRGLPGSSSESEAEVSEEGGGVEAEDQWWTNSLRPKKGVKPTKRQSLGSLKAECDKLAHAWLVWGEGFNTKASGPYFNGRASMLERPRGKERGNCRFGEALVVCTSFERSIRTCLLQSGANCEQEEAAADGRSCGRHRFDGMAL